MLVVLLTLRFCSDPGVIYSASQSKNELVYSLRGDTFFFFFFNATYFKNSYRFFRNPLLQRFYFFSV